MRITKLWVKNAAGLKDHWLDIPSQGVTIFQAGNESGKSTLAKVPELLIGFKFSSKDSKLESIRNILESSKPLVLGMEYWIGPNRYSIEKSYLSESKAFFQQLEPDFKSEVNAAAEAAFQNTIQSVDLDLFRLLSVAQAQNLELHEQKLGDGPSIGRLLELAAGPLLSESIGGLSNSIEKARQEYFTATGKPTTSGGTKGSVLSNREQEILTIDSEVQAIRRKHAEIEELVANSNLAEDADTVQYMFEAQQRFPRLTILESQLREIEQIDSDLISRATMPSEKWTEAYHNSLAETRDAFIAFSTSGKVKIKALKSLSLSIEGQNEELDADTYIEFSTLTNHSVKIPDLLEIQISNPAEDTSITEAFVLHESILKKLNIEAFADSEKMLGYTKLSARRRDILEQVGNLETLRQDIQEIRDFRDSNAETWARACRSKPITLESLNEVKNLQFRVAQIQKDEDNLRLEGLELLLRELNEALNRMTLERSAVELLFKTMDRHRSETKKQLAPIFKQKFDEVCSSIFQGRYSFSVDADLRITSRKEGDLPLGIEKLSVGAKETLGLLIRLTICKLASLESPLPLILDDDFAFVDRTTASTITAYISSLVDQQVILFTHQPEKFPHLEARAF